MVSPSRPSTAARRSSKVSIERHVDQAQRQDEVHGGTGHRHADPLPERLLAVGARFVGGIDRLDVVHPDDLHVGAGRDGLDAVFGLATVGGPDAGTEAQEELGGLHAGPLGHDEVAELVQGDHHH
jgi:hypothetical protein